MHNATSDSVWTVAEAKARLSEILRRAKTEGPQRIGVREAFVVVPEHLWQTLGPRRKPMGQWLVDHMPRGAHLEIPGGRESRREIPFMREDAE